MLGRYFTFLSLFLAPFLAPSFLSAFESDCDFLDGSRQKPPQTSTTEGTIEDITGDGDTYYDEQTDDGDWYYGKALNVRKSK